MGSKIKVLQVGLGNNPGGIESCILNYHRHINLQEVQFDYADIYGNGLAHQEEILALGGKIHTLPNYKQHPLEAARKFERLLKLGEYDIVHLNMLSAANLIHVTTACKLMKHKVIVHCHNSAVPPGTIRKILNKVNMRKLRSLPVEKWACSVVAGKWMWGKEFSRENVIYNAIDEEKFRRNPQSRREIRKIFGFSEQDIVMGFVGRFATQKNVLFIPEVLAALKKKSANYKILFVGDGELGTELKQKIREYGLGDSVGFAGVVNDTAPYYSAMDGFLLPSLFEGLAIVALEAQAAGLQCFVSDGISPETNITNTMEYLSLEAGAEKWAETIAHKLDKSPQEVSFPNEYKIKHAAKKLEERYREIVKS